VAEPFHHFGDICVVRRQRGQEQHWRLTKRQSLVAYSAELHAALETGLEEIRRERNSIVPHFSQADLSILIPLCICSGVGHSGPRSFGPSGLSRTQASVFARKIRHKRQPSHKLVFGASDTALRLMAPGALGRSTSGLPVIKSQWRAEV
jgi:hypothetical protein